MRLRERHLAGYDVAAWIYLSGRDVLNSVRQETDAAGSVLAARSFDPYGVVLSGDGGEPFGYTGEYRDEASGLVFLRARYLQVADGRFITRDTWPGDDRRPITLNAWVYSYNNSLRYTDRSGYDPLDDGWVRLFKHRNRGAEPTDVDRQDRLYSLMFDGIASGRSPWTDADWAAFRSEGGFDGVRDSTAGRAGLDDFARALTRLASHYWAGEGADFVSAIALIYAGVPYAPGAASAVASYWQPQGVTHHLNFLNHGMAGFNPMLSAVNKEGVPEENVHHYAGHLLGGYYFATPTAPTDGMVNCLGTAFREYRQAPENATKQMDWADVWMGTIAGIHGGMLFRGLPPSDLPALVVRDLR